jgi:Ca-activated chloride channel family protein
MRPQLSESKNIAQAFFGTANPDDEFLLLTVSSQPAVTAGFTTGTSALEESIAFAQPGGLTALIDTVYLGLSRMREAQRARRALLIISDGKDNHSRYSESDNPGHRPGGPFHRLSPIPSKPQCEVVGSSS